MTASTTEALERFVAGPKLELLINIAILFTREQPLSGDTLRPTNQHQLFVIRLPLHRELVAPQVLKFDETTVHGIDSGPHIPVVQPDLVKRHSKLKLEHQA